MYQLTDTRREASLAMKKAPESASPWERLSFVLWQAQHLTEVAMEQALVAERLSPSQVALLVMVHQEPALSGAELARRLHLTPQSVATAVGQLETRGLVTRQAHRVHRKVIEIFLTDEGLQTLRRAVDLIRTVDAQAMAGLGVTDRAQLRRSLEQIARNFGASVPPAK